MIICIRKGKFVKLVSSLYNNIYVHIQHCSTFQLWLRWLEASIFQFQFLEASYCCFSVVAISPLTILAWICIYWIWTAPRKSNLQENHSTNLTMKKDSAPDFLFIQHLDMSNILNWERMLCGSAITRRGGLPQPFPLPRRNAPMTERKPISLSSVHIFLPSGARDTPLAIN